LLNWTAPKEKWQMFKNILIATDGSELARHAVTNGLSLAKSVGAKVSVIIVDAPMHAEPIKKQATEVLKRAAEEARLAGVTCNTIRVEQDQTHKAIIAAATDNGCDLIVMASHGRGALTKALLGSVTHKVLTHTTIPVLVCH
jgi:nucleotide-binding universal stress UspA family protein